MKLGIVVPLKSKTVSKNWQAVCRALFSTLESIKNQTNSNYQVIVVGHECPDAFDKYQSDKIDFLSVSFPPPDKSSPTFSHKDYLSDKNQKINLGVKYLKQTSSHIDFWFQLDSDDLMSKNFIAEIAKYPESSGFIIDSGYLYYQQQCRIIYENNLTLYCGSTSVIADKYMPTPELVTPENVSQIPWCRIPHMHIAKYFDEELKHPAVKFEIPLLAYVLSHGDNISDGWRNSKLKMLKAYLKPYIKGKRIDKRFLQEYAQ